MATQSGLNILTGFQVSAYSPIDTRYLYFGNTVPVPYASTSSAIASNPYYRYQGLTVLIGTQSNPQEYWWQNGTSDSDLVIKQKIGGLLQYAYKSYFPNIGSPNILYVDQSSNLSYYWSSTLATYSCTVDIFTSNPTVYLGPSYSFGKYINGMEIPAIGKTPQQVILDAISQPLTPTVVISVVPTTVPYNTTSITATISVSYNIKSSGATAASGVVSYASDSNPYTPIANNKIGSTPSYSNTFTYSFNYPTLTQIVSNFRYYVIDTQGAESKPTFTINMTPYSGPSISIIPTIVNPQSFESTYTREIGNIGTTLSSSAITINSPLVPLSHYQLYYSNDGTNYSTIGSTVSINSGFSITPIFNNSLSPTTTTGYFGIVVTDIKQSSSRLPTSVINFYYPYFVVVSSSNYTIQNIINDVTSSTCTFLTKRLYTYGSGTVNVNTMGVTGYLFLVIPSSYPKTKWASSANNTGTIGGSGTFQSYTTTPINDGYCTTTYNIYYNVGSPLAFDTSTNNYAFSA